MAIDSSWGSTNLQRSEIFKEMFKQSQLEPLMAKQWVNWIGDIPKDSQDTTLKINSLGELSLDNWTRGVALPDRRMDTGQFLFNINSHKGVKVAFERSFFETSFQANQTLALTPDKMKRALDVYLETEILKQANNQTKNDANIINLAKHRYIGSGNGTTAPSDSLTVQDFSYAKYALKQAGAPMSGLVAIVTPLTEHNLNVKSQIVDVSNNPMWGGIINTGLTGTGLRFIRNIYGFDVYVSSYLDTLTADEATLTTYNGTAPVAASITGFDTNIFMAFGGDSSPIIGAYGREPTISTWTDESIETEYHQLTASFGFGLYRPENMITVQTNPASIA